MSTPTWQVSRVTLRGIAGYSEITWGNIQPDLNLIVGRNGCGKSLTLQTIAMALNFLHGRRGEDILTAAYEQGSIALQRYDGAVQELSFQEVRAAQTAPESRPVQEVVYFVESRRPKSRIGRGRSQLTQHSSVRYDYLMGELQAQLRDRNGGDRLTRRIIDLAQEIGAGSRTEWEWTLRTLQSGGPRTMRPMSCGQYDVLAVLLDLVRAADARKTPSDPLFVIIDNPDAFLHPAVQENLIALILREIPGAQIFLATHSLKLLARREPRSVFWLSRDRSSHGAQVSVQPIRELDAEGSQLFYELYGTDASTAVLDLVMGLDATEYLKFLCECSLPCSPITRNCPEADPQMQSVVREISEFRGPWSLLDFGAGAGDLLTAGLRLGLKNPEWEYVAFQHCPSEALVRCVQAAKDERMISLASRVISELSSLEGDFDAVVLCNTCHAIAFSELPVLLARLLGCLRHASTSRLVIHEVELLRRGEGDFIMWTHTDYAAVFMNLSGVKVEHREYSRSVGVPLHTSLLRRVADESLPGGLAEKLSTAFQNLLPFKLYGYVKRRADLRRSRLAEDKSMAAHLVQRHDAFLSEQIASIASLLVSSADLCRQVGAMSAGKNGG